MSRRVLEQRCGPVDPWEVPQRLLRQRLGLIQEPCDGWVGWGFLTRGAEWASLRIGSRGEALFKALGRCLEGCLNRGAGLFKALGRCLEGCLNRGVGWSFPRNFLGKERGKRKRERQKETEKGKGKGKKGKGKGKCKREREK